MSYHAELLSTCCCGVKEIGHFYSTCPDISGKTPQEFIEQINNDWEGFMVHIHFVKYCDADGEIPEDAEWTWPEVRDVVIAQKGVVHMGTFVNPNTSNLIDSYCWIAG